jgi:2-oxoglutarate dehydrogenase E1 component
VKDSYQEELIRQNVTSVLDCDEAEKKYRSTLEKGNSVAHNLATKPNESMWFDWTPYINQILAM